MLVNQASINESLVKFCFSSFKKCSTGWVAVKRCVSTFNNRQESLERDQADSMPGFSDHISEIEEYPGQFSYRALRYFSIDPSPLFLRGTIGPFSAILFEEYLNEKRPLTLEIFEKYAFKFACKSMVDELDELFNELKDQHICITNYLRNMKIFANLLRVPKKELADFYLSRGEPTPILSSKMVALQALFQELQDLNIPIDVCVYERLAYIFFKCKSHASISKLIINMKIKLIEPTSLIYYFLLYLLSSDKSPLPYLNAYNSIKNANILSEDLRKLNLVWSCSMRDLLTIIINVTDCINIHRKPSFFISLAISELIKNQRKEDVVNLYTHFCNSRNNHITVSFTSDDLTLILDSCIHTASFSLSKYFLPLVMCKEKRCPIDPIHDCLVLKLISQSDPSKLIDLIGSLRIHRNWNKLNSSNINIVLDACYKNHIVNHYMFDILESNITTLFNIYEAEFPTSRNAYQAQLFDISQSRLHNSLGTFKKRMKIIDENFQKPSTLYELACLNLDPLIFRVLLLMAKHEIEPVKSTVLLIFYYYVNVRANILEISRFYSHVKPFLNEVYYGAINSLFSSTIRTKCWHVAASLLTYINLRGLPLKSYNLPISRRLKDLRYTGRKFQISCDTQRATSLIARLESQLKKGFSFDPDSNIELQKDSIIRILTLERLAEISDRFAEYNILFISQLNDLHQDQRQILFKLTSNESTLLSRLLMVPDLQSAPLYNENSKHYSNQDYNETENQ